MTSPTCLKCQSSFSAYLDGDISGRQMHKIASHLESCAECKREFTAWRATQQVLASVGPAKAPADLALRLRLAISHEHSRRKSSWIDTVSLKWDNAVRPMLLQVSAGFAGTVALVGGIALLLGLFAAPEPVMANDEPLGAMTSPHYLYSSVNPHAIVTDHDGVIIVEASVNSEGKVYDYRIVSGPESPATQSQVVDQLLTSVFQPASVFGAPVRGRVVLTFSGISVRG
ncbi:zf-HC2 domain-containing protein [Tunturiibacter gelidoferens]|uniref:Anti-sigma factor RsiW n=1 Tax=Tunturiibacter lichenicola TaxID=2051959 RepID=A0A7Y9NQA8_9BACT|nr:zf-HC2 domain-containing protein [Edaphobacter lichenicola]NYF53596.1 anti-sigma factor RsiW [Edaphobacter lichenicola]